MKNLKFRQTVFLIGSCLVLVSCKGEDSYSNKIAIPTLQSIEDSNNKINQEELTESPVPTLSVSKTPVKTDIPVSTQKPTKEVLETEMSIPTKNVMINMTDEEVLDYINKIGDQINECSDNVVDKVKDGFIIVVDFIFYDGTIGGRTFDSLKDSTKSKVLEIYDTISNKIEENLPIWKEKIGEKYEDAKNLWDEKKDDLSDIYEGGKQKVKNWYENFRREN